MDKKQLLKLLKNKYPDLGNQYIERIVDKFFQIIAYKLKENKRIEIRNFGTFRLKNLGERGIYNPHTKQLSKVPSKKIPAFRCSSKLHKIEA